MFLMKNFLLSNYNLKGGGKSDAEDKSTSSAIIN